MKHHKASHDLLTSSARMIAFIIAWSLQAWVSGKINFCMWKKLTELEKQSMPITVQQNSTKASCLMILCLLSHDENPNQNCDITHHNRVY